METGVPLPYDLSAHNIGGLSSRRLMVSNMDHALPFYSSSPVTYASPCHSPYGYGHNILNTLPGHYQQLFGPRSQPPHPHSPPNIRHGRNILPGESRGSSFRPDQVPDLRLDTLAFGPTSNEGKQSKATEPAFSTEVDMLMKAIQSKSVPAGSHQPSHQLPSFQELSHAGNATYTPPYSNQQLEGPVTSKPTNQKSKRKYECTLPHCKKSFSQKTHLDIHMRAHTGDKPFVSEDVCLLNIKDEITHTIWIHHTGMQGTVLRPTLLAARKSQGMCDVALGKYQVKGSNVDIPSCRTMKDDTPAKSPTPAISARSDSLNGVMCVLIKSHTNRRSPSPAAWMIAESSLHSLETSRFGSSASPHTI